jgi:hypothetical protein
MRTRKSKRLLDEMPSEADLIAAVTPPVDPNNGAPAAPGA